MTQGAPAAVDLGARGPGDVSVAKKGTLHVHGSGFEPGETVRIELHVKKKVDVLASVVADEFGLAIADVNDPGRRPARRPGDLAGRPVGHGHRRRVDHHARGEELSGPDGSISTTNVRRPINGCEVTTSATRFG